MKRDGFKLSVAAIAVMGTSMRDRNSIRHMVGDSSDVDLALARGQPLRVASVKQFFRRITLLHRGVGDMR